MSVTARVLVVASDEDYRAIDAQLGAHGYASRRAGDGGSRPDIAIVAQDQDAPSASGDDAPLPVLYIPSADGLDTPSEGHGLSEYLSPTFSEIELLTRLRGLSRLATMREELERRMATTERFGVAAPTSTPPLGTVRDARVIVVADDDVNVASLHATLGREAALALVPDRHDALRRLERDEFDAVLTYVGDGGRDWLDLVHSLRGNARLYNLPILAVIAENDEDLTSEAYRAGVNDVIDNRGSPNDIAFRVLNQVRQMRYRLALQTSLRQSRHATTTDSLTGLYSRGFLQAHLTTHLEETDEDRPLSLAYMRLDTLAWANRALGHAAGDLLLRQVGGMIGNLVRGEDLAARFRGDEFVISMPDTTLADARVVTSRLCGVINSSSFALPGAETPLSVHLSVACIERVDGDSLESFLRRARRELAG